MESDIVINNSDATTVPSFSFATDFTDYENTTEKVLPIDMKFNGGHKVAITLYTLLMITSAIGNITVFVAIVKLRIKGRLSRINMFLLNLAVADLFVTFLMMPLEIGWNATVSWDAGDAVCRIMSFFRIFGLYLSGFVIICISLDRYFAVVRPFEIGEANRRAKFMLVGAWIGSLACSLPQSYIFHVESHPEFKWYEQCVTFNSFPSQNFELAYNFSSFFFLYIFPLITIMFCYASILHEIYQASAPKPNGEQLRRSSTASLGRAKIRTLKMTVIIVATFFFCWTPYNIMSLWYWFDKKSAMEVDPHIQKALFLFACTNSVMNPLIYGLFHFRKRQNPISSVSLHPRQVTIRNRITMRSTNYLIRFTCGRPTRCCIAKWGSSESNIVPASINLQIQREELPLRRGNATRTRVCTRNILPEQQRTRRFVTVCEASQSNSERSHPSESGYQMRELGTIRTRTARHEIIQNGDNNGRSFCRRGTLSTAV